jgi:hypothetical protein
MAEATLPQEILSRMDEAIQDEFEKNARLRKILPAEIDMPGANYGVVVPRFDPTAPQMSMETDLLRRPIMLEGTITFESRQLQDLDVALDLVRAATRRLCNLEDSIIAYGKLLVPLTAPPGVQVRGLDAQTDGLFDTPSPGTGGDIRARVEYGTTSLDGLGYHLPYGVVFAPAAWTDYVRASDKHKNAIIAALGGDAMSSVSGEPPQTGGSSPYLVLFAHEPANLDLVRVLRPCGTTRGYTDAGDLRYIVESRFLLRVKNRQALYEDWSPPNPEPLSGEGGGGSRKAGKKQGSKKAAKTKGGK